MWRRGEETVPSTNWCWKPWRITLRRLIPIDKAKFYHPASFRPQLLPLPHFVRPWRPDDARAIINFLFLSQSMVWLSVSGGAILLLRHLFSCDLWHSCFWKLGDGYTEIVGYPIVSSHAREKLPTRRLSVTILTNKWSDELAGFNKNYWGSGTPPPPVHPQNCQAAYSAAVKESLLNFTLDWILNMCKIFVKLPNRRLMALVNSIYMPLGIL